MSTVRKLELGQRRPSKQLAEQIARVFNLPENEVQRFVRLARRVLPVKTSEDPTSGLEQEYNQVMDLLRAAFGGDDVERMLRPGNMQDHFWRGQEDLSKGHQQLSKALAGSRSLPTVTRAKALHLAGALARTQSDYDQAWTLHQQSLELFRKIGDAHGIADELDHLAWVAVNRSDYSRAKTLAEESLRLFREMGDQQGIANALNHLGWIALANHNNSYATLCYGESLELAQELGDSYIIIRAINNLGETARARGDYKQAKTLYHKCLIMALESNHRLATASVLHNLGYVALYEGASAEAKTLFTRSLLLFREFGDKQGMAECLTGLAGVAYQMRATRFAAHLLGAATYQLKTLSSNFQPTDYAEYSYYLSKIRTSLADSVFTCSWNAGQAMDLDQAVEYALGPA